MKILAIDPGSNESSFVVVDTRGGNGSPISITFISKGTIESTPRDFDLLMMRTKTYGVDVVALERVKGHAFNRDGGARGVVAHLNETARVEGGMAWACHHFATSVHEMSAREWRAVVLKKPSATDAQIKKVIPNLIHGFPSVTNAHVRDAAGLAVATAWTLGSRRTSP